MKRKILLLISFLLPVVFLTACWSEAAIEDESEGAMLIVASESDENLEGDASTEDKEEDSVDGKHVRPITVKIDLDDLKDGNYIASFRADDINLEGSEITCELYVTDYYEAYEINMLQIGDVIQVDGEDLVVESIEDRSGSLIVNGGFDKGGCDLWPDENDTYVARTVDDYTICSELGKTTLRLSDTLLVSDSIDDPSKPVEVGMDGLSDYLENLSDSRKDFSMNNTLIGVRGGKVVDITRIWVP